MSDPILEYLWRRFPHHCRTLTDPGVRGVIALAARRAGAHGFTAPEHVCSWVNLMIFCGAEFDDDPLHEWARQSLRDTRAVSRDAAIAVLFQELNANTTYLGKRSEHYRAALSRVTTVPYELLLAQANGNTPVRVRHWLRTVYPERCDTLPSAITDLVAARAAAWTDKYRLDTTGGAIVCALIILLFGSHADRDPIRWWAREALSNASDDATPDERARGVHAALVGTLRRFAYLQRLR
jgi:hypothetical protein